MSWSVDNLMPGDPVKVAGHRGLWRFIGWVGESNVEVVGPYTAKISQAARSRIVARNDLQSPGKATREQVAMSPIMKTWKRGK
jgi:hypothetical protein